MAHNHHHHTPSLQTNKLSKIFIISIALNLTYVIIELIFGFKYNSLALISDAGHNFFDAISLILAALAFYLQRKKPNKKITYGYKKTTIIAAFINSLLLLIAVGGIISQSIKRLSEPAVTQGNIIASVAAVGVVINFITAFLFFKDSKKDINIKGAFLHLLADGLVSVGVVVSGLIISKTGLYWIDPVTGLIIGLLILKSSYGLLKESYYMSIDAVPLSINIDRIEEKLTEIDNVNSVHHIHIWPISSTETAFTGHIVVKDNLCLSELEEVKEKIKQMLKEEGISHSTIEFEYEEAGCNDQC